MNINHYVFVNSIPTVFRQYMLENDLYEHNFNDSLFKKIWKNEIIGMTKNPSGDFIISIVENNSPIGCVVYEKLSEQIPAIEYTRKLYSNKIKQKSYDWCFRASAICGFYVKPEYRNMKVASLLLQESEKLLLQSVDKSSWQTNDIPVLLGARRAVQLVNKASNYFRGLDKYGDTYPRREQINEIIKQRHLNELYPDDPYPNMKKINDWTLL